MKITTWETLCLKSEWKSTVLKRQAISKDSGWGTNLTQGSLQTEGRHSLGVDSVLNSTLSY